MTEILKKVGFIALALVITAGVYWIIYTDKESKQDTLEYALALLGKDLLAKVPDSEDKKPVQILYENFLKQAAERKVPREQVEHVAINLLNLSNVDTTLTPEQAEAIIKFSLTEAPSRIARPAFIPPKNDEECLLGQPDLPCPPEPNEELSPEGWETLGERIKALHDFNVDMQRTMKVSEKKRQKINKHIQCRVEKGLVLRVNAALRDELRQKRLRHLTEKMEKEHILIWQENFEEKFEHEMDIVRVQLDSLDELKELGELEALKGLESLKFLESLKSLESLKYIPVIEADSIKVIIKQSLEEAGIYEDDEDDEDEGGQINNHE